MKSPRYFIVLIASLTMVLFIGLSLTACHDESQVKISDNQQEQPHLKSQAAVNTPEINQEVKDTLYKYAARIDSILGEFKNTIDKVDSMDKGVGSMNKKVSELKNIEKWWWVSCGIGIIAFIISIISLIHCRDLNKRLNRYRDKIQELRQDKQSISSAPRTVTKTSTPPDYNFLKQRVYNLECQISQFISTSPSVLLSAFPSADSAEIVSTPIVHEVKKSGYFGSPINTTEPYFKKLLVSGDSDARFIVEISGNKALFRPLESSSYFGTFVSTDAMRAAIDFNGCLPSEASSMRVITLGEAEQRDNKWVITKKVTVELS